MTSSHDYEGQWAIIVWPADAKKWRGRWQEIQRALDRLPT